MASKLCLMASKLRYVYGVAYTPGAFDELKVVFAMSANPLRENLPEPSWAHGEEVWCVMTAVATKLALLAG